MTRGLITRYLAIVGSLLVLIVAGSQALAESLDGPGAPASGQAHRLRAVDGEQLPSERFDRKVLHQVGRDLQVVIGADERQRVVDTTRFPNSSVTYIEAWQDGKDFVFACSAAFVGPNVLLTAAHCLWIPEFDGFPDGVALAPGLNGKQQPFGVVDAAEIWVPDEWIDERGNINRAFSADYGLIVLDDDRLGEEVGTFSVAALPDEDLAASDFQPSTAGYPADKPRGTQWFGTTSAFKSVNTNLLVHEIDAFQGQSGSPVWRGDDLSVVGVVSFETSSSNYARRITASMLSELESACSSLDCSINVSSSSEPTATATPSETEEPAVTESPEPTATEPTATATEPTATEPVATPQGDLEAFDRAYRRTDDPVEMGVVDRTWIWGPAIGDAHAEAYDDAPGGQRAVRYHEKSRMEINAPDADPSSIWYVTNGLLARELVTGEMQLGDNRFEQREPANVNAAGDGDDPDAPAYASFLGLLDASPAESGEAITAIVDRDGIVGDDPELATLGVTAAQLAPETNHMVASVFWEFLNSTGTVNVDGAYVEDLLFQNPYFATGLPITEPYWAWVKVGGTEQLVLIQVFERRVLTYTPGNPPGWQVEAGNVGTHYLHWRYGE